MRKRMGRCAALHELDLLGGTRNIPLRTLTNIKSVPLQRTSAMSAWGCKPLPSSSYPSGDLIGLCCFNGTARWRARRFSPMPSTQIPFKDTAADRQIYDHSPRELRNASIKGLLSASQVKLIRKMGAANSDYKATKHKFLILGKP